MDGLEATTKMRNFWSLQGIKPVDQPVIIGVTGHAQQKFIDMGKKNGMNNVMAKPIYFKDMQYILKENGLL